MIDARLRPLKDRLLGPVARRVPAAVSPLAVSVAGAAVGLAAAVAAGAGRPALAVVAWLVSRVLDGLDGAVARHRGESSDLGGYADIVLDTVVYAAVPLGVAVHADDPTLWVVVAVLLAAFYLNAVSWAYLAALLEKRSAGAAARGEPTSVTMPRGLVEGTETVVVFTLVLAVPATATLVFAVMAAAVGLGVAVRAVAAVAALGAQDR